MSDDGTKAEPTAGDAAKVVEAAFEPGRPEQPDRWRAKLRDREEMLGYLRTADRYWVVKEGFGSERRKNPA